MGDLPEGFIVAKELLQSLIIWYTEQIKAHSGTDSVLLARLCVLALSQYSATVAVDVGMTEEQFINVCKANFKEAYEKAPKFG